MDQFYAATKELLSQGGLNDSIGQFDYADLAKIFNRSFLTNVDEAGNCVVDLQNTKLTAQTQKALLMLMQSQKFLSQNKSVRKARKARSERQAFQDQDSQEGSWEDDINEFEEVEASYGEE